MYRARLSRNDHHNSRGVELRSAAGIVRQDRANYHRYVEQDFDDQYDSMFADRDNRAWLEDALEDTMSASVERQILRGTPVVEVRVWGTRRAEVSIVSP